MPPNQHNQPTPPSGPRPSFTPQAPHFDYNSAPRPQLQQHPSGQYEVIPAPTPNSARPSGHNPYEFIVNPNTPKNHTGLFGGGKAPWKVLAFIGTGLVVLMIIAAVVISNLAPKGSTPGLTAAAQREQEIIRIATAATKDANGQDTKNFVANVQISISSNQLQTLGYLQSHGTKLKPAQLALAKNAQTDSLLTDAASAGTYDKTVVQNLSSQLTTYEGVLTSTFDQSNSKSAQALLRSNYATTEKLLAQAKSLSN